MYSPYESRDTGGEGPEAEADLAVHARSTAEALCRDGRQRAAVEGVQEVKLSLGM